MDPEVRIVSVDASNVGKEGFFCCKSKRKSEGYQQKQAWLEQRFEEGLKLHILYEGKRSMGYIEYLPGEYGWRAVNADGYLLIHCIWMVGRGKNKGYASRLLDICTEDARQMGAQGVAVVTSRRVWLAGSKLFLKHGFEVVDQTPPFELLVRQFGDGPLPSFPTDWDQRSARYGSGLTVLHAAGQCPYLPDAVNTVMEAGQDLGIDVQVVQLNSSQDVQRLSPSPFGVFGIVHNGKLLSYYYMLPKDLAAALAPGEPT